MTRLVASPVFILSPIRSGSTLLRCILNTHSRVCAPHELHVADLEVNLSSPYVQLAMKVAGLDQAELQGLLWDRVYHWHLERSGKDILVDKTPGNLLLWRELHHCWPRARFIFLLRNPARIVASALANRGDEQTAEQATKLVLHYIRLLDEARGELNGLTVRYEELTRNPERVMRGLCAFLNIDWEPRMLDYGAVDHGPFLFGIGDFTDAIRSGRIGDSGEAGAMDAAVPPAIRVACDTWGYPTPTGPADA